ncbi:MAG TPA: hypothetical protein VG273_09475 [Bryobacteraceae bacterium]|jgi:hypothetical protein|nr:hypothetical protein [Bryobacteraceae bacterium]
MDTLILILHDRKLKDQFEKLPLQMPSGVPDTRFLTEANPTVAQAALGVPGDILAAQNPEKTIAKAVKKAIFDFAKINFEHEKSKPPAQQKDMCEFQIVFMFHQSDKIAAKGITDGLTSVGTDAKWYQMPFDYTRAHRVRRVWLMSCESAADETGRGDPALMRYVIQSNLMREAAADGVMTFLEPPRPAPPLVLRKSFTRMSTLSPRAT